MKSSGRSSLSAAVAPWLFAASIALAILPAGIGAALAAAPAGTAPAPAADPLRAGRFVWQDLITRDAAACRAFYSGLFGWEFTETTRRGRPYSIARSHGEPVAGIVASDDPAVTRAAWLSYLTVVDLARAVASVTAAGGKVLVGPVGSRFGQVAVVTDPQQAPIGLAQLDAPLPASGSDEAVGRFFWREYFARDAAPALDFYRGLGGFADRRSDRSPTVEYHLLERDGPRAGLLRIPDDFADVKPNWLPYVRVEDPVAAAERAVSLGGKVLLAPRPEIRGGTVAIVADPSGGAFAIQKWPIAAAGEAR
jgi:predicted enzyme related to lactoylglutathione lyase